MLELEDIVASITSARAEKRARSSSKFNADLIRRHLTPWQQEAFDCSAPAINILGGRQCGKTFLATGLGFLGALSKARTLNAYFALTAESVGRIMWPEAIAWCELLGLGPECRQEHIHTVTFPNGSAFVGTGTDDKRKIETWRGVKANTIVIDEMGAQPDSFIEYFIGMLWPTLIKNKGRMLRMGNPGLTLAGYWFNQTNPKRLVDVPLYHATAWDNPHLGTPEETDAFVDAALHDAGLNRDSATYKREWLAQWVEDVGALVFPLGEHNRAPALPRRSRTGAELPKYQWRYVVGVDIGYMDATAITVVASHPLDPREWVISTEKHSKMLVPALMTRLRELVGYTHQDGKYVPGIYDGAPIVMDTGGMGKYHAEELTRMYDMAIEPAEKREKESAIRLVRDLLLSGTIVLLNGAPNDALRDEWQVLGWDKDRRLTNPAQQDHASDATLYALRRLRHYREHEAPPPPTKEELLEIEMRAMRDAREREVRKANNTRKREWDC